MRPLSRFFLALAILAAGCARETPPPPQPSVEEGLQELAKVYSYIEYSKSPLPQKPEDFRDYWDSLQAAFERVQKGDIVVVYGVGRSAGPAAAQQILAYDKKAPTEGGFVLLRSGTVKQLSAAEFASAPKAK